MYVCNYIQTQHISGTILSCNHCTCINKEMHITNQNQYVTITNLKPSNIATTLLDSVDVAEWRSLANSSWKKGTAAIIYQNL